MTAVCCTLFAGRFEVCKAKLITVLPVSYAGQLSFETNCQVLFRLSRLGSGCASIILLWLLVQRVASEDPHWYSLYRRGHSIMAAADAAGLYHGCSHLLTTASCTSCDLHCYSAVLGLLSVCLSA